MDILSDNSSFKRLRINSGGNLRVKLTPDSEVISEISVNNVNNGRKENQNPTTINTTSNVTRNSSKAHIYASLRRDRIQYIFMSLLDFLKEADLGPVDPSQIISSCNPKIQDILPRLFSGITTTTLLLDLFYIYFFHTGNLKHNVKYFSGNDLMISHLSPFLNERNHYHPKFPILINELTWGDVLIFIRLGSETNSSQDDDKQVGELSDIIYEKELVKNVKKWYKSTINK